MAEDSKVYAGPRTRQVPSSTTVPDEYSPVGQPRVKLNGQVGEVA
jgi:hypothetical protein